jgi:hypothetical protein
MDATHYLSRRFPRCTRTFFRRPMRCCACLLPSSSLTSSIPSSLNTPFHSSFIIRSTTRRSLSDPKSYKTPSRRSPPSFQPSKIYSPSGTYTASSSHVAPHATRPSSSTARSTRLQILIRQMQNPCTRRPCSCSRHSSSQMASSHTTTQP